MAVTEEQRVEAGQPDAGRTAKTGAGLPVTAALVMPCKFPATNTVITCPGATATGGYRYPIPTIRFTDALWPNAPGRRATQKRVSVTEYFIILTRRSRNQTGVAMIPE